MTFVGVHVGERKTIAWGNIAPDCVGLALSKDHAHKFVFFFEKGRIKSYARAEDLKPKKQKEVELRATKYERLARQRTKEKQRTNEALRQSVDVAEEGTGQPSIEQSDNVISRSSMPLPGGNSNAVGPTNVGRQVKAEGGRQLSSRGHG